VRSENTYRWRVTDRAKPSVTKAHLTEAEVRRDYPECEPVCIEETLLVREVPETAEESLAQWLKAPPR